MSVYLATFVAVSYTLHYHQCAALAAATLATAFTVRVVENGKWNVGFFVPPRKAAVEFLIGAAFATVLVLAADGLVIASSHLHQIHSGGFPALELMTVFIPAAVHEELAFRGYLFQKMRLWNRAAAIGITAILFALLHAGNRGISAVAIGNLMLAGVLLALAYERYRRLWFPIGIHLAWNILSGPILGYGVSGYVSKETLLRTVGTGQAWVTGGEFGIEGSVWMALVEAGGIFLLAKGLKRFDEKRHRHHQRSENSDGRIQRPLL